MVLWSACLCPPKTHMLSPDHHGELEGGPLGNDPALQEWHYCPRELPPPLALGGHTEHTVYEGQTLTNTKPAGLLILDFRPAFIPVGYKSSCIMCFITAA